MKVKDDVASMTEEELHIVIAMSAIIFAGIVALATLPIHKIIGAIAETYARFF